MVVNINQNPSCFDETLNVLKFSALAQKVSARTHTHRLGSGSLISQACWFNEGDASLSRWWW